MRKIAKCIAVAVAVAIYLWVCGQLGYRYLPVCKYLTSPVACLGKMICWGGVLGTAIGTAVLIAILLVRKIRDTGYLSACAISFAILATLRLTHLVVVFCS